jgi:hypothetical protein
MWPARMFPSTQRCWRPSANIEPLSPSLESPLLGPRVLVSFCRGWLQLLLLRACVGRCWSTPLLFLPLAFYGDACRLRNGQGLALGWAAPACTELSGNMENFAPHVFATPRSGEKPTCSSLRPVWPLSTPSEFNAQYDTQGASKRPTLGLKAWMALCSS